MIDRGEPASAERKSTPSLLPFQIVMGVISASIAGIVAVLGELRDELGFRDSEIGIIVTAGFAAAFISQITLARYADRGHGRLMASVGVALSAVSLLIMGLVDEMTWWFIARGMLGFAGGLALPGLRRAATVLDPKKVGENLGRLIVGEVGGFLAGPIVAAGLAEAFGVRAPFFAFAGGMVLFLPFVLRLPADAGAIDTSGRSALTLLRTRRLQGALLVVGGYFAIIGAWESVLPGMYQNRGGGALEVGITFTLISLPVLLLSRRAGRFADRVGPPKVAVIGTGLVSLACSFLGLVPGLFWPAVMMLFFGVSDAYGFTAAQVAVSRSVPEDRQAAALGLMGAIEVLGAALTALPAALLFDRYGEGVAWLATGLFSFSVVMLGALRFRGTRPAISP